MAFYSLASTFAPGDVVLTSQSEYASNVLALPPGRATDRHPHRTRPRRRVRRVVGRRAARPARARPTGGPVRLVAVSWIPTQGGLVNPAAEIGAAARDAGIPFLLDACQAVGQLPGRRRRARVRLPLRHRSQVPAGAPRQRAAVRAAGLDRAARPALRRRARGPVDRRRHVRGPCRRPPLRELRALGRRPARAGRSRRRGARLGHRRHRVTRCSASGAHCATSSPTSRGWCCVTSGRETTGAGSSRSRSTASTRSRSRRPLRERSINIGVSTIDFARTDFEAAGSTPSLERRCTTTTPTTSSTRLVAELRDLVDALRPPERTAASRTRLWRFSRRQFAVRRPTSPLPGAAGGDAVRRERADGFCDRGFVRVARRPALGAQLGVRHDPRVVEVRHDSRWHVADAERPRSRQHAFEHAPPRARARVVGGTSARRTSASSQPSAATLNTPGRSSVAASASADARSSTCTTCTGNAAPRTRNGGRPRKMRPGSRSAPGPTTVAERKVVTTTSGPVGTPRGQQPLDLRALHRGRERVRPQWCVLGERDRVVRPRAVDGRARHPHDLPHADVGRGREHPPRALDVHPCHERLVGDRIDDAREVHHHVDALEHRPEVGAGDVDPVECDLRRRRAGSRTSSATTCSTCGSSASSGSNRCPTSPDAPVTAMTGTFIH